MKTTGIILTLLLSILIWITVYQYLFCPRYTFKEPQPFHGQQLYNPYQNIDSTAWAMCNFHAHSSAWGGLTNGKGTSQDIWDTYDSLGYAVHLVSDYQKIDNAHAYHPNFIPSYEHGFNINKVHHLVLGEQIFWLDYLLPQILSNKQWMLNQLNQNKDNLIIMNHPNMRNGIEFEDVKYLSNYHCMEVLSPYSYSVSKWDSTLSAGKSVFLVGSDDIHNVYDKASVGRYCTVVNARIPNKENIMNALKRGSSYGMKISNIPGESFDKKIIRYKTALPQVKSQTVMNDTLQIVLNKPATEIIFYGQNGKTLDKMNQARVANYLIKESDSYVRAELTFEDGTMILMNPIYRYEDDPFKSNSPIINQTKSKILGFLGILILLAWGIIIYSLIAKNYQKPSTPNFPDWFPNPQRG